MILDAEQRRILTYVGEINRGGYQPTVDEVEEWRKSPKPMPGKKGKLQRKGTPPAWMPALNVTGSLLKSFIAMSENPAIYGTPDVYAEDGPPESFLDSLIRLGWLCRAATATNRLLITDLGRALLRAEKAEEADAADVLILSRDDPLAYATLIGAIAELDRPLIVDPYLKAEHLVDLIEYTSADRFLVGPKVGVGPSATMQMLVDAPSPVAHELREAAAGELHDRYIVSTDAVYSIGTSMNGVKKTGTLLMPLPDIAASTIRTAMEGVWDGATTLAKSQPPHAQTPSAGAAATSPSPAKKTARKTATKQ